MKSRVANSSAWILVSLMLMSSITATGAVFQGLGTLAEGESSFATSVSADGSVVVGYSSGGAYSGQAFRWTPEGGMIGLGYLPGEPAPGCGSYPYCRNSSAKAVLSDGSLILGTSSYFVRHGEWEPEYATETFAWTEADGMIELYDGGLTAASADGSVAVWTDSDGQYLGGCGGGGWVSNSHALQWTAETGRVSAGWYEWGRLRSRAMDVSADGSVMVGTSETGSTRDHCSYTWTDPLAYSWTAETGMVQLGDLPGGDSKSVPVAVSADGSTVIGRSESESGEEAFRWTPSDGMVGLGDLPGGGFSSRADAVSADGSVVVGSGKSALGTEAFRWTPDEGMVGLGVLPGGNVWSRALLVSADGSVVVGEMGSSPGQEVFYWTQDGGMRSLQDMLVDEYGLNLSGWALKDVSDISDDGAVIVGYGYYQSAPDVRQAWRAAIPEPSALMLLLTGLVGLLTGKVVAQSMLAASV